MVRSAVNMNTKGKQRTTAHMGMAASQARLLSLTARLQDVEFEAQAIEAAKLKLADAEDEVYQRYLAALDATQITGSVMRGTETATVFANFNNLCGGWENMILKNEGILSYGLVNQKTGYLYVTKEIAQAYNAYKGDDSEEFALLQMGYSADEVSAYIRHRNSKGTYYPMENGTPGGATIGLRRVEPGKDSYSPSQRYYEFDANAGGYKEVTDMSNSIYLKMDGGEKVFTNQAQALYVGVEGNEPALSTIVDYYAMHNELISDKGQYYKHTYEMIMAAGGCEVLDEESQSNSEWLTNMVGYGKVGIYTLKEDISGNRGYRFQQTSTATSSILNDTTVTSIDNTELKRAEAEYNRELKAINKKDTQFDLALEDLETERTAITTEMEAVRTVIDDNVKRTFGIFS